MRRISPGAINCSPRRIRPLADRSCGGLLIAVFAFLAGCVENKPYRLQGVADAEKYYAHQLPPFEEHDAAPGHKYRLSFVEFDERGDFWDRRQFGEAAHAIRHSDNPVLLVIYIHGWHHNANERKAGAKNPGDVETFRCLLSQLAVSGSAEKMQVHGVYLGWRGRLVEGPLDYLTFWGRKAAATRVAGTPVTETIFELVRQARKKSPERSKCVLIGHSFGALVLEKAMAQAMTGSILAADTEQKGEHFNAPADLVLLINSASESIYAKEMRDMFERIEQRGAVNPDQPLIISITSESDSATSHWFRIGSFFPNLFSHRQYHWDTRYDRASHEVDQNEYLTTTPGHNKRLWSHRIDPTSAPNDAPSAERIAQRAKITTACSETNPAFEENLQHPRPLTFATGDKADSHNFHWWKLTKDGPDATTPYWIMHVPKEIIDGHAPIFTPQGRAMMAALYRITNPESGPRKMQLRAETRPANETQSLAAVVTQ